jgi:voltage-gated potassium channel
LSSISQAYRLRPIPPKTSRWWKAQLRYIRIALTLFWRSLLTLFVIWSVGGAAFLLLQTGADGARLSIPESLWCSLMMMAAQPAYPFPQSVLLQFLYFALPVLGLFLVADTVVRFGLLLLDKRANEKEWMRAMAATARNHVILCGIGSVGFRILEELIAMGQEVVAIERNAQSTYLSRARDLGATILLGDATVEATLLQAGLDNARAVIAATDNDIANLETVLDARRMKPGIRVVMRIFDHNTAQKLKEAFGVETLSSSSLSAPTFALSALGTDILGSVRVGSSLWVTARFLVSEGSSWCQQSIAQISKLHGVVVLAFCHGQEQLAFAPEVNTTLQKGDQIIVQGPLEAIDAARIAATH